MYNLNLTEQEARFLYEHLPNRNAYDWSEEYQQIIDKLKHFFESECGFNDLLL